jgi:hypothetical protein
LASNARRAAKPSNSYCLFVNINAKTPCSLKRFAVLKPAGAMAIVVPKEPALSTYKSKLCIPPRTLQVLLMAIRREHTTKKERAYTREVSEVIDMMIILSAHLDGQSHRRAWHTDATSRGKLLSA